MTVKPNITCKHSRQDGYDINSKPKYTEPKSIKCAVVKYKSTSQKTTVRADSSASRGRNQEMIYSTIILFDAKTDIRMDDVIEIFGEKLIVESIERRFDIGGKLDHYECGLNVWV